MQSNCVENDENGDPASTSRRVSRSSLKEIKRVISLKFNNFANTACDLAKPKKRQTIFDLDTEERLQMYTAVNKAKKRYQKKCERANKRRRGTTVSDRQSTFTKGLTDRRYTEVNSTLENAYIAIPRAGSDFEKILYPAMGVASLIMFFCLPKIIHWWILPWLIGQGGVFIFLKFK